MIGPNRKSNEDAVLTAADVPIFAVADGTGGAEPSKLVIKRSEGRRLGNEGRLRLSP